MHTLRYSTISPLISPPHIMRIIMVQEACTKNGMTIVFWAGVRLLLSLTTLMTDDVIRDTFLISRYLLYLLLSPACRSQRRFRQLCSAGSEESITRSNILIPLSQGRVSTDGHIVVQGTSLLFSTTHTSCAEPQGPHFQKKANSSSDEDRALRTVHHAMVYRARFTSARIRRKHTTAGLLTTIWRPERVSRRASRPHVLYSTIHHRCDHGVLGSR
jgi:hypothetical protein